MIEVILLLIVIAVLGFFFLGKGKPEEQKNEVDFYKQYQEQEMKEASLRTEQLEKLVEEHQDALIGHWYSGRKKDEYGQVDETKWVTEANRFLEMFNYGKLKRERVTDTNSVSKIIEKILEERKISQVKPSAQLTSTTSFFESREISDAWDFEKLCSRELNRIGWISYVSSGGGDQGIDVVASKDTKKLVLQCKLYNSTVGNKAVQEAIAGKAFEDADYAAVIAPNGFTKSARELALKASVLLLHPRDLQNIDHLLEGIS